MAVPKRRHSKSRTRNKRRKKMTKTPVCAIKTKTGYKRPHIEEDVKL